MFHMFHLLRLIIWVAGLAVVAYFVLGWFGYTYNFDYFKEQQADCQAKLDQCKNDLIKTGINGAKETCQWNCVDPKLIIRKN